MLAPDKYEALLKTVDRDCKVLQSFGIMDYSLLVGIHNMDLMIREKTGVRFIHMYHNMCNMRWDGKSTLKGPVQSTSLHSPTEMYIYSARILAVNSLIAPTLPSQVNSWINP